MSTASTEHELRQATIDRRLREAGWDVTIPDQVGCGVALTADRVDESHTAYDDSREFADYVLYGCAHSPVTVIEAKRSSRDALADEQQAQDYADALEAQYGCRPMMFLTNGPTIWIWDSQQAAPREVSGFFTLYDIER